MKIHVAITTYNRPQHLLKLLSDIKREKRQSEYIIDVHVYDDASSKNYIDAALSAAFSDDDKSGVFSGFRFAKNNGKKGYWRVIDRAFQDASQYQYDYFFLLQDDCELVEGFFEKAVAEFEGIADRYRATLCTFTPTNVYSRVMWGGRARDVTFRKKPYIRGNYVDCIFMCPRATLEKLNFQVTPVPQDSWDKNQNRSSGVGEQLTGRIADFGGTMYTCYSSLVLCDEQDSLMNKEERLKNPLRHLVRDIDRSSGSTDSVFCGIASIPSRVDTLQKTLLSIAPQVDKVFVALNGYRDIPTFAKDFHNVEFFIMSNDKGDANKYARLGIVQGFYFSCDDDIIYPKDYVEKMKGKIIEYGMKTIVTCHGRTIIRQPIQKFYTDTEQTHFLLRLEKDKQVHIPGTGVCAFHTDHVAIKYDDFIKPNMADIWLGVYAKNNNIPVYCIQHERRWLHDAGTTTDSIFRTYKNNDTTQVGIVNSVAW